MEKQLDLFADYVPALPGPPKEDPAAAWRLQRKEQLAALGLKIGVPLHEEVEVRLVQGIRLQGLLRLANEENIWADGTREEIVLRIEKVTFRLDDLESLVRL